MSLIKIPLAKSKSKLVRCPDDSEITILQNLLKEIAFYFGPCDVHYAIISVLNLQFTKGNVSLFLSRMQFQFKVEFLNSMLNLVTNKFFHSIHTYNYICMYKNVLIYM